MKYQIIYILIGSITLIVNIILLLAYLKLNFSILDKKSEKNKPKEFESDNTDPNIVEPDENTVDFDEEE